MSKVVVLRGLPASGKSRFARQYCLDNGAFRLNMDDQRAQLGFGNGTGLWTREKETVAFDLMVSNLVSLVKAGQEVVVDNTHVRTEWLVKYKKALQFEDAQFQLVSFTDVALETCLARNALRADNERVPEGAILKMAKTLKGQQKPVTEEWLNEGRWVKPEPYVPRPGTRKAVICDLDGTLALMTSGRGPYEFWRVEEDSLNEPVAEALRLYAAAGYAILVTSGRDAKYRKATERWLGKYHVFHDELFMRPEGDTRNDAVVKVEIFDCEIRDEYNVVMSLDDRARVVRAWRALGLSTWQVNPGDF